MDLIDDVAGGFCDLVQCSAELQLGDVLNVQAALVSMSLKGNLDDVDVQVLARVVKTSLRLGLFHLVVAGNGACVYRLCFHCLCTFGLLRADRYGSCA